MKRVLILGLLALAACDGLGGGAAGPGLAEKSVRSADRATAEKRVDRAWRAGCRDPIVRM